MMVYGIVTGMDASTLRDQDFEAINSTSWSAPYSFLRHSPLPPLIVIVIVIVIVVHSLAHGHAALGSPLG